MIRVTGMVVVLCATLSSGVSGQTPQATAERCAQLKEEQLRYERAKNYRMLNETIRIRAQLCPGAATFLDAAVALIRINEALDPSDRESSPSKVAERRLQAMDYLQEALRRKDPPLSATEAAIAAGHIQHLEQSLVVVQLVPADVASRALVQADGRDVKVPADRFWVAPGAHTFVITSNEPGLEPFVAEMPGKAGGSAYVVHVTFTPKASKLGGYRFDVSPAAARVEIDGKPGELDRNGVVWLQPGTHSLRVAAPGYHAHEETLEPRTGELEVRRVKLDPIVRPFPVGPVVVAAVGAAMLIAGGVTGGLAMGKKADLADKCPNKVCDPMLKPTYDSAQTLATVTDVLMIGGVAALGAGLVWYLAFPPVSRESPLQARLQPVIGPTQAQLSLSGTF